MNAPLLFPFAEYWWLYAGFTALIGMLLALDLGVFHRESHVVGVRESLLWSAVWIVLGLGFGAGLWLFARWHFPQVPELAGLDTRALADEIGLEYLAGYVVEKALAVDNIFVIAMVFGYFAVPPKLQHRVLFFGILGAIVFRAAFIAVGSILLQYHWVLVIAGIFLIFTGVKMLFGGEQKIDPERNILVRLVRKFVPVTSGMDDHRFFKRIEGRLWVTPLFLCLVFVEATDVIFAIDSVPAIFALTSEPLVVFTSNIFAILGLRSLYFLLANAMNRFHLLKYGLAFILVFVGLKMSWLDSASGGKFPIPASLAIIGSLLALSVIASLAFPRKEVAKA